MIAKPNPWTLLKPVNNNNLVLMIGCGLGIIGAVLLVNWIATMWAFVALSLAFLVNANDHLSAKQKELIAAQQEWLELHRDRLERSHDLVQTLQAALLRSERRANERPS